MSSFPWDIDNPGCTMWPEGNWHECCVAHDYAYADGGPPGARKEADKALRKCVETKHTKAMGLVMYLGVRAMGWFFWRYRTKTRRGDLEMKLSQGIYTLRKPD